MDLLTLCSGLCYTEELKLHVSEDSTTTDTIEYYMHNSPGLSESTPTQPDSDASGSRGWCRELDITLTGFARVADVGCAVVMVQSTGATCVWSGSPGCPSVLYRVRRNTDIVKAFGLSASIFLNVDDELCSLTIVYCLRCVHDRSSAKSRQSEGFRR